MGDAGCRNPEGLPRPGLFVAAGERPDHAGTEQAFCVAGTGSVARPLMKASFSLIISSFDADNFGFFGIVPLELQVAFFRGRATELVNSISSSCQWNLRSPGRRAAAPSRSSVQRITSSCSTRWMRVISQRSRSSLTRCSAASRRSSVGAWIGEIVEHGGTTSPVLHRGGEDRRTISERLSGR